MKNYPIFRNVRLTHTHTQFKFLCLMMVAVLLPWSGLSAQFSHPNTTDIVVGSCKSYGVEHTGTSLLGDWQVTVVDGDKPSIIFYNHETGQEDCHLLEAANHGFTVIDPDVVWNY